LLQEFLNKDLVVKVIALNSKGRVSHNEYVHSSLKSLGSAIHVRATNDILKENMFLKIKLLSVLLVAVLMIIALLINPLEIYYCYRTEKEIIGVAPSILRATGNENAKIVGIEYLGGKVYLLETDGINYLIRREQENPSRLSPIHYEIYTQHEIKIVRCR